MAVVITVVTTKKTKWRTMKELETMKKGMRKVERKLRMRMKCAKCVASASPCYFIATRHDVAQYGIECGWLPLDFNVEEEDTVEHQEAHCLELLQEPGYDLEAVKE